ncbi:putative Herpesviridae UL52 UL70 DNA primase [Trypanosoma vivax]|nr:putative Herpesviridae UL52 UL70 DNA primase [Trypanosoma vivax]
MLWCRATFVKHFGEEELRVFPTQQQMFDFIDLSNKLEAAQGKGKRWLPFSIEFPSEEEVVHQLASRSIRALGPGKAGVERPSLFRKRSAKRDSSPDSGELRRPRCVVRGELSVWYGETPLSMQSRMFLAATANGLARVMCDIEPAQLHLYEVIREGMPCHLYLDVERERDYSAWHVMGDLVGSSDISCTEDSNSDSGEIEICNAHECKSVPLYRAALAKATWRPPRCCPWDCGLRADNTSTSVVLLRELGTFIRSKYPDLLTALGESKSLADVRLELVGLRRGLGTGREAGSDVVSSFSQSPSPLSLLYSPGLVEELEDTPLGSGTEVMILRSVPIQGVQPIVQGAASDTATCRHGHDVTHKFSQHYVIKFAGHWFKNNAHVGHLVGQFVDYLYERATVDPSVHTGLFYHDRPREFPVLPPPNQPNLLFLPLRCVIDTAVYSRNRMMRCLGSCKLHKTSLLVVERAPAKKLDPMMLFFTSLITLPIGHRKFFVLPGMPSDPCGQPKVVDIKWHNIDVGIDAESAATDFSQTDMKERLKTLVEHITREWNIAGGADCHVVSVRYHGERSLVMTLGGSRYCGNVGRQHRSNGVYITVDLEHRTWAQKCFDPDCGKYRGPYKTIPADIFVPPPLGWKKCIETGYAAALTSHAALRTVFRPARLEREGNTG